MNISRSLLLSFLMSAVFASACGNEKMGNQAKTLHTWGEVVRGTATTVKPQCKLDTKPAARRLHRIAHSIALGNPEVFSGVLDLSQICIQVNPSESFVGAHTDPSRKTIVFGLKLMASAQSDEQLAAVVAHELAHITLQHAGLGEISPRVLKTPEGAALSAKQGALQKTIQELTKNGAPQSEIFKVSAEFEKTIDEANALTDKIYGEKNANRNWIEQEADEVAAEFLLKAGYPVHEFANMLWLGNSAKSEEVMQCNNLIYAAWDNATERPERGAATHPTTCWRVFHLLVDEYGPSGAHAEQAKQCPRTHPE
jgi:hypothetical protein